MIQFAQVIHVTCINICHVTCVNLCNVTYVDTRHVMYVDMLTHPETPSDTLRHTPSDTLRHSRRQHTTNKCEGECSSRERWGAGVETQKNVRGEIGGWGRVPFNETYAPSLSTIYDGA